MGAILDRLTRIHHRWKKSIRADKGLARVLHQVTAAIFAMTALGAASPVLADTTVESIRLWADESSTRVVVDLSEKVAYTLFPLRQPDRLVIDLSASRLGEGFTELPASAGVVAGVRTARRNGNDLRIVLDLASVASPRTSFAGPLKSIGERLVIDLEPPRELTPTRTARAPDRPARDIVIAIDAGHGGRDPGAIGRNRTREKDVVLSIANRLAERIDAEPGMRAHRIRSSDTLIDYRERMASARRQNADLFVSIHADAFKDPRARGSSVYALSLRGASSEAARWLAASHNADDLIGGISLSDKDAVLASVLMDLSQNAAISAGVNVGKEVLDELGKIGAVHKRKVQQAEFIVLKSPDVPSILIETAFISNPEEERKLRDAAHQARLAEAVLAGLRRYFRENPPPKTLFAQNLRTKSAPPVRHVIKSGDTLSEIAQRYNVQLLQLRDANQLRGDQVHIGQVLTIPIG